MKFVKILPIALALSISACAAQPKYNWGSYSPSLYSYYKDSTTEGDYEKSLSKIISAEGPKKKIPPGILAEYGYMKLAHGDAEAAVEFFEREKKAWPESAVFMDTAIKLARSTNKPVATNGSPVVR